MTNRIKNLNHPWFRTSNHHHQRHHNHIHPRSRWPLFMEKQQQDGGGLLLVCGRTLRFFSCLTLSVFLFVVLTGWNYGPLLLSYKYSNNSPPQPQQHQQQPLQKSSSSSTPISNHFNSPPPPPQQQHKQHQPSPKSSSPPVIAYPQLVCSAKPTNQTCAAALPTKLPENNKNPSSHSPSCPAYFRWIHEDLRPWKSTGVTRKMLDKASPKAHFRLIILRGKLYIERYKRASIQTRAVFTIWGVMQLLRRYPGRLPDLELMFDCDDRPVVPSSELRKKKKKKTTGDEEDGPPPIFRYCSDGSHLDIVFPDWSFWGWAEIKIKPWRQILPAIKEGSKKVKWEDRVPYAYWKGNPTVYQGRKDLMKCNVSDKADWNARLYVQDWHQEAQAGYKQSHLEDQCTHRYKIYMEGWAWSVSEKYILACDAMTLMVRPRYHDFFSRSLIPMKHYWPIRDSDKCRSLKFAVDWGNNHTLEAKRIGEEGSRFVHEDLALDLVYDYMLHLLTEYAKLQRFQPTVPPGAVEFCPETMACGGQEEWRRFIVQGLEMYPRQSSSGGDVGGGQPCGLPPAYEVEELKGFVDRNVNLTRQIESWESEYWAS